VPVVAAQRPESYKSLQHHWQAHHVRRP
jgi:hypothetical protein